MKVQVNRTVAPTLAVLTIVAGAALAAVKIVADGEPGAIPLLLIVSGVVWYPVALRRPAVVRDRRHVDNELTGEQTG